MQDGSQKNIGFWNDPLDSASWLIRFGVAGRYAVTTQVAMDMGTSAFNIMPVHGHPAAVTVPASGGWDIFETVHGNPLVITQAGDQVLTLRPSSYAAWHSLNLASLTLTRLPD